MEKTTESWSIQARTFRIRYTPFCHNFWVLADPAGQVAEQLHGLAFDARTGAFQAWGNSSHLLQAVRTAAISWSLQAGQAAVVCAAGPVEMVQLRWQAAVSILAPLNSLALPYPGLWQHFTQPNSNSVFAALGRAMGFAEPAGLLPGWAPGIRLKLATAIIEEYGYRA